MANERVVRNPQCDLKKEQYSPREIKEMLDGKKIYLWGAGQKGRPFLSAMERNGYAAEAFLDSAPVLIGTNHRGVPILDPKTVLGDPSVFDASFIILTSTTNKIRQMALACNEAGLVHKKHYLRMQELAPLSPSIEISGVCNLRCIACPRGKTAEGAERLETGGFMSVADYKKVLQKLLKEIPWLFTVDLYIWSDPLLHPKLAEIIEYNNSLGIGSGISTNMNHGKYLEAVIKAGPDYIRVSTSGFGPKNYEITHTGGRWDVLYKNLLDAKSYIKKHNSPTIITVLYHANKNNLPEFKDMHDFCVENGFRLEPLLSSIFSDYAMDYIEKRPLWEGAEFAKNIMLISLDEILKHCALEHSKTCLAMRALPVINWDLSVLTCCNYSYERLAPNYLDITIDEIINLRNNSGLCKKCIEYSLHRFWDHADYTKYLRPLLAEINKVSAAI
ncbi:MAG: radical SAM protein [Spirochaetaceae bacterium]|jgi:MoaA/NifB/PqqE/SkfB family radical SAM enzyme|nr:radical SAM protein [Spirochaetaceae bacterium]